MFEKSLRTPRRLIPKSPLRLRGGVVRCERGAVWITIEGDRRDYVLRSGESMSLPESGWSVCEALSEDAFAEATPLTRAVPTRTGQRPA